MALRTIYDDNDHNDVDDDDKNEDKQHCLIPEASLLTSYRCSIV
jgi:hypothetical protein